MLEHKDNIIQLLNTATVRERQNSFQMDKIPGDDLLRVFARAYSRKQNWSKADRLKIRQISRQEKNLVNQCVEEVSLRQPEDVGKLRAEFPNLKKVKICMPTQETGNVAWFNELSKIKGLQELCLNSAHAVDAFAEAVKDWGVAERFGDCFVFFKYGGQFNRQEQELENIATISQKLKNTSIVVDYTVKELIGTRGPMPFLKEMQWLDNVFLNFKLDSSDIDFATMQYIQEFICVRKTTILEAGFVGGEQWIDDQNLLSFLNDNPTLRSFSFGHPKVSKGKKVCYLSKAHVSALSSIPELHWTMYSDKEWGMLTDFPNICSLTMAETLVLPKISFWQSVPNLRELHLQLSSSRGSSLRVLSDLKNLRSLTIHEHGRSVPPPWLEGLAVLKQIQELHIYAITSSISVPQLQILTQLTGLNQLSLEFRLLNISNLGFVVGLRDLEVLKLKSVENLRNEVVYFQQIRKLLNLRELHISLFKNNSKHVKEIKKMLPCKMCRVFE